MKPLRILYVVVIVVSLAAASFFYWQSRIKDITITQYENFTQISNQAIKKATAKLLRAEEKLEESSKEIEELNGIIAVLEKEKTDFKGQLSALKQEREKLNNQVALLAEERTILEKRLLSLVKKFHSLEELKKAIKIAKIEEREKRRVEREQMRLVKEEMLKALDKIALQQGNRGYLVKNGEPTYKPRTKVKVELEPVEKLSYRESNKNGK